MHDRHKVFNHLSLRRELLLIENENLATVRCTEMFQEIKTKPCETIFVCDNQMRYLSFDDAIYDLKKMFPFEV